MKILFSIFFLFAVLLVLAQSDSIVLKETIYKLDKALVQKDVTALQTILHKDISYGHSNGWIQTKAEMFNDFKNGNLSYNKIESVSLKILAMNKKLATVRMDVDAAGIVKGSAFNLSMSVMQVWMKTSKRWQLLARQSGKK